MRLRQASPVLLMVAGVLAVYWATLPPDDIVFDRSCQISGLRDHLAAALHGDSFWEAQLEALRQERAFQMAMPAAQERQAEAAFKEESGMERRMSHLSETDDRARQDLAARQAQRRRMETIAWLSRCESVIAPRLGPRPK